MIVDTNVLIDLFALEETISYSFSQLAVRHRAVINPVIFAEASSRFRSLEVMDAVLEGYALTLEPIDRPIAYCAGQAFHAYRRQGGPRDRILPDFLIGAHAAVRGWPILTRDRKRFAAYFPDITLIDPLTVSHD